MVELFRRRAYNSLPNRPPFCYPHLPWRCASTEEVSVDMENGRREGGDSQPVGAFSCFVGSELISLSASPLHSQLPPPLHQHHPTHPAVRSTGIHWDLSRVRSPSRSRGGESKKFRIACSVIEAREFTSLIPRLSLRATRAITRFVSPARHPSKLVFMAKLIF